MHRRKAVAVLLTGLTSPLLVGKGVAAGESIQSTDFAEVERRVGGRIGVTVLDVGSRRRLTHRANERFPMCSTFKLPLAARVLSLVDAGTETLTRVIPYSRADLLAYSDISRAHVGEGGMTVSALLAAALQYSDNTAANLLLHAVGGPSSLTAWIRGIGDSVTRFDHGEPDVNTAVPGDPRDTTSPNAMAADMAAVLVGNQLTGASRELLVNWLVGNTTGTAKLRAGLPGTWRVGDKTGNGAHGTTNDVAIIWPAARGPVIVTAYFTETTASGDVCDKAFADIGRAVSAWVTNG